MESCDIIPLKAKPKACSGKCSGVCAPKAPGVWLAAACGGMIALFEKDERGRLSPLVLEGSEGCFASMQSFMQAILAAAREHRFGQLLLVGSANDVAWLRAALPDTVAKFVAAEVEYPLLPAWFRRGDEGRGLTQALGNLFQ